MRFKFMPTPSAEMHLGHAWIVLVMERWCRHLRHSAGVADLALVFDVLTNDFYGRRRETSQQYIGAIARDLELLGISPGAVICNHGPLPGGEAELDQIIATQEFPSWHPGLEMPVRHFLKIAAWDRHLGVTHIVRGDDRLPYDALYRECYAALGYPAPRMEYVPVVLTAEGARVSAGYRPYCVQEVRRQLSREELAQLLDEQCLSGPVAQASSGADFFELLRPRLLESPRVVLPPEAAFSDSLLPGDVTGQKGSVVA